MEEKERGLSYKSPAVYRDALKPWTNLRGWVKGVRVTLFYTPRMKDFFFFVFHTLAFATNQERDITE